MHRLEIALTGFPGSGKTTLWNALTGSSRPTGDYMGRPHVEKGVFLVPDGRLGEFGTAIKSKKTVPFHADVYDVTGLISMEGGRAAVSDELLSTVRHADLLVLVLRAFSSGGHPGGAPRPADELAALLEELHFRDINLLDNRVSRIEETVAKPVPNRDELKAESVLCRRLLQELESGGRPRPESLTGAERGMLKGYRLFSLMPLLVFVNTGSEAGIGALDTGGLSAVGYPAAMESELAGFGGEEEAAMRSELGLQADMAHVFAEGMKEALDLVYFYTGSEKEANAWALYNGDNALEAAGTIHSDIAQGFIRAEVTPVDAIIRHGGYSGAKKANATREEGREYVMLDGDVITVRFSR
ncbi:MAG: redox-regulated ATPase YchF [Planctomycetes bacterium]|nr:redox-regulated ATPase YchF [Planctomycetota bacterium]